MIDSLQYYPTPPKLATTAWGMFNDNMPCSRILEPSAGQGALLLPLLEQRAWGRRSIDVIEVNLSYHPILRELGCRVVDTDFLQFNTSIGYDRILMNPPFNQGVEHVLRAWSLLHSGQLVAIINAETLENPYSAKRQTLSNIIAAHGHVRYIDEAFETSDTQRKTSVRVAVLYLCKEKDITINVTENLEVDQMNERDVQIPNSLILPNSTIKNMVLAFNTAEKAMKTSIIAEAEANYYHEIIGKGTPMDMSPTITFASIQKTINKRYDDLKIHAWSNVIKSADFTRQFSRNVRKDIETQIDELIHMSFTVDNIHALLAGLLLNKSELDYKMIEDVFDLITKYHTKNRLEYVGWKSNDKHRNGFKIRKTRFILPNMKDTYMDTITWNAESILSDIDKVFSLLDGMRTEHFTICDAIEKNSGDFYESRRISSHYFDVRFFPGAGTLHFFPRDPALVDRLNRIVGKRRQWLPDNFDDDTMAECINYDNPSERCKL